ncbi:hypothetical protein D3C71_1940240 [compost metagenome]
MMPGHFPTDAMALSPCSIARCTGAAVQSLPWPIAWARSFGPMNTASTPSTAAISAATAMASGVSIMAMNAMPSLLRCVWPAPPNAP